MLSIVGGVARSAHQRAKLSQQLRALLGDKTPAIASPRFVYFIDAPKPPSPRELVVLKQLLHSRGDSSSDVRDEISDKVSDEASDKVNNKVSDDADNDTRDSLSHESSDREHQHQCIIVPRIGTISAWSNKATDIARRCGLTDIARIERGVRWRLRFDQPPRDTTAIESLLHDPMTESVLSDIDDARRLFARTAAAPLAIIDLQGAGLDALNDADAQFGLALSEEEKHYLLAQYQKLRRNPTDVEVMMFAQVNSEHCRHKIFNAEWVIDGQRLDDSPFAMIRQTHRANPRGVLSAYNDNAAVLRGHEAERLLMQPRTNRYARQREAVHFTAKVETHNHPTAIAPFAGAATGAGGEIRDGAATGRGGAPLAGIAGFAVSHLHLPNHPREWEREYERARNRPPRLATPLQIMLDAPIGAAAFNNEFGRPMIGGYFRVFEYHYDGQRNEQSDEHNGARHFAYHKPIMLSGGVGAIRPQAVHKQPIAPGTPLVSLGGAVMLIGLGGGAASSGAAGDADEGLDFASVQRANAEMQRRCQEVIDACIARGADNPIVSIHDVGAGGLCNALPELVHDSARGGTIELRAILSDEPGLSPLQIWCNESQERYVLAIDAAHLEAFAAICHRERCPHAVVGHAAQTPQLRVTDSHFADDDARATPIDLPMQTLFGAPPTMRREVSREVQSKVHDEVHNDVHNKVHDTVHSEVQNKTHDTVHGEVQNKVHNKMHNTVHNEVHDKVNGKVQNKKNDAHAPLNLTNITLAHAAQLILRFPSVADKSFLITIGDRSVGGRVVREPMIGPWQTPVADVGIVAAGHYDDCGIAVAIGERPPLALIHPPASGRIALGEAITNIACAHLDGLDSIKLSANWMVAAGQPAQDAALYDTVRAVTQCCVQLGVCIPVGKDSMAMNTVWRDDFGNAHRAIAPLSPVITAFAAMRDVGNNVTPQLCARRDNDLWLLDLANGRHRLGGSTLAQATAQLGNAAPDLDDVDLLRRFFACIQHLIGERRLLAYHDRSDGGALTTLCEMAFAARCGLMIELPLRLVHSSNDLSIDSSMTPSTDSQTDSTNDSLHQKVLAILCCEELGAVIQTARHDRNYIEKQFAAFGLTDNAHRIGHAARGDEIRIDAANQTHLHIARSALHRIWSETSHCMQTLRDNPECAAQQYAQLDADDPGLFVRTTFAHCGDGRGGSDSNSDSESNSGDQSKNKSESESDSNSDNANGNAPSIATRPKVAILREQGVNGHWEMAAAFDCVGFDAVDVTMSDLAQGGALDDSPLNAYSGLVACGGFSFGDVLGAGEGWAKSILYNARLHDLFAAFFQRNDVFALGVCNGCQMMAAIAELIPGSAHWPTRFARNHSEQFESRIAMVEICAQPSILLQDMHGSMLPIAVAHGEGRAQWCGENESINDSLNKSTVESMHKSPNPSICMRFVDNHARPSETYPSNPNGSPGGATGFTNADGRFTMMMPHPERVVRTLCHTWRAHDAPKWGAYSPWLQLFRNARAWVN